MPQLTYAIGDIHGRRDLLEQVLALIEADAARRGRPAKIVFTGDYLDRGPDSYGVVERLIEGPGREGDRFVCLRGNHDDLFVRAITSEEVLPEWATLLHHHTLASYGTDHAARYGSASARRHAAFLSGLPLTHDDGTYLFVHAGIRPGVTLADQAEHDLLWIRDEFLTHPHPLGRRVVHGHTIVGDAPVTTANRISIDTGAYRSGVLTAAVLDGHDVSFLQARGEPDRGAIIREARLHAMLGGRGITQQDETAFAAYLAGDITLQEMERLTVRALAA